jgi:hypothetical protein
MEENLMAAFDYSSLVAQAQASGASATYEPLPVGDYAVSVEKAEVGESKKGDPQLVITYKVSEGPFANRKLWHRMTFIPSNGIGLAINFRQLDVLGATPILEQGGTLAQVAGFLTGKSAVVKVSQREWNGKINNDVDDVKKGAASAAPAFAPPVAPQIPAFTGEIPAQGGFNPAPVGGGVAF